jgi:Phage protein Gp138 N-terminal domain
MASRTPGVLAALDRMFADFGADLHVALPGQVVSYDASKQVADVKPMVQRVAREQDDDRAVDPLPVIPAVPVAFARGGGYFMTLPLASGDTGLLVFCERDLSPWRATGQDSDPLDEGVHTLAGAVFYPGLHTEARALPTPPSHLVLGKESGGPELHVGSSTVDVGASGGSPLLLASASFLAWIAAVSAATSAPAPTGHVATKAKGT